jgi:hypothetical protein
MVTNEADIIGFNIGGELSAFEFEQTSSRLRIAPVSLTRPGNTRSQQAAADLPALPSGCAWVDMVNDAFMARTAALTRLRWDSELRLAEQEDFFLRGRNRIRVAACAGGGFRMERTDAPICTYNLGLGADNTLHKEARRRMERLREWALETRRDMLLEFWPAMMSKHGLVRAAYPSCRNGF